jgi:hypothetical protein
MAITKRLVKGSALSHTELDGNFTDYETFKALFDSTTFTGPNDGKLLFWNNSTSKVEVKTATTSEVTEGTNLYYTDTRFDTRLGAKTTDDLSEGSTNLYFTNSRADVRADARITAVVTKSFVNNLYVGDAAQNSFEIKTSSFNAVASVRYMVDTTGGVVTATLPGSPSAGDTIEFTNGAENFATNNLIVGRNGNNIDGSASDLTVSANPTGGMLTLIYDGATWRSR